MAFREVRVYEVREVLRLWLDGEVLRSIERLSQVDRKTVRRYVTAAEGLGLARDGGAGQLADEFVGAVVEVVRPIAATVTVTRGSSSSLSTTRCRVGPMMGWRR